MLDAARHAMALTGELVERFGPRPAGSQASRDCADALAQEAGPFADDVRVEDFEVRPGAFLGWIRMLVALYAAATAGLWLDYYAVSAALVAIGLVILVMQFLLYKELLDPLYPRRTGRNVLASLEPDGVVRGELIVSGHHDSARIFNFLVHQPRLYALRLGVGVGSLVLLEITALALTVLDLAAGPVAWSWVPAAIFSVLLVNTGQLWWFASSRHTPGAGDNLASTAAAWQLLRMLSERKQGGQGLAHLRVTAASWDAEEAGLRGARAWRRAHGPLPHPTWNLNLECLYDPEHFTLLTTDINGSVALSGSLVARCARLMKEATGREVEGRPIAFLAGGTDAAEVARAGAEATTLLGMPWSNDARAAAYHTPRDTLDAVSETAVVEAITLATDLAEELDGELEGS